MNEVSEKPNSSKLKTIGWLAAAVAFVSLALLILSFSFMPLSSGSSLEKGLMTRLVFVWIINGIALVAGLALHRSEKVKSAIVIALAFFFMPLLYVGTALYFKSTRLKRVVFTVGGICVALLFLLVLTLFFNGSAIIPYVQCGLGLAIAVLHLVFAACFVSRQYLPIEDFILKGTKFLLKPLENIHPLYNECGYKVCFVYGCSVFIVGIISILFS